MNIAFFTDRECCPMIGGTERTTSLVADSLKNIYGHKIFSIYNLPVEGMEIRHKFSNTLQIGYATDSDPLLAKFLNDNEIDLVINQGNFYFCETLNRVIKDFKLRCRQIFVLHFMPGSGEEALISFKETFKLWRENPISKEAIKVALYPLYYRFATNRFKEKYRQVESMADRIVLLSDSFKDIWMKYAHEESTLIEIPYFDVLPNGLTFQKETSEEEIRTKEKSILIVARFDERQKRISSALKMWKEISEDPIMKDWRLDIVGDGKNRDMYHSLVKEKRIPRVTFHGRQNPQPYYEKASLFMMTSKFEGFAMTIVEASQFGVVSIAFNTYPALTDILTDGANGFVIEDNNFEDYKSKLIQLASDSELRVRIALNAVENSKRYSPEIIAEKWQLLITKTVNE